MRKWTLPLTVVGLGGLGALFLSSRGRKLLRAAAGSLGAAPLESWNAAAQRELDHIEEAVRKLEQSLRTDPAHS